MTDLTNSKLIYLKGFLFLCGFVLASALVVLEHPTMKLAVLLGIAIWCSARFYYFMFYVIERYVDRSYRFSGIFSFVVYVLRKRK